MSVIPPNAGEEVQRCTAFEPKDGIQVFLKMVTGFRGQAAGWRFLLTARFGKQKWMHLIY